MLKAMKNNQILEYIISQLRNIQDGELWMGDTFESKISSISEVEAFTRPLPNLHSPAELIAHLNEWRKDIIFVIKNGHGQLTMESHLNWRGIEELKNTGWGSIIEEYKKTTAEVIGLLQNMEDSFLKRQYREKDFSKSHEYSFIVNGLVHHDLYHLGQLGIVIKLIKEGTQPETHSN
jgi:hypothetical protein